MRTRLRPSPEVLDLARLQGGVLTTEQLRAYGLSRSPVERFVAEGWWQRLDRGLFYTSAGEASWLSVAWGGVLLGGDQARLGDDAAGHLHGLLAEPPSRICVRVPHGVLLKSRDPWLFRQERPGPRTGSVGSPPRLSFADTVLDMCDRTDERGVVDLVTRAVQSRKTTPHRLRSAMALRTRMTHRALLGALLADVAEGVESALELAYLRDVERAHGLPRGTRQHLNRSRHRRDVRYDEFLLVVELDGRLGHEGTGRFRDMRRDNDAVLSGETTLRYGWIDVADLPCAVACQVGTVLADRGWTGVFTRCRRCRLVPVGPDGWVL